jgi:hypothetical protein
LGGPIGGGSDGDIALLAVEAQDESQLRSIFKDDPWMVFGVFRIKEVRSWTWWLDGRRGSPIRDDGPLYRGDS